jgi:hypothetical protein
MEEEVWSIKDIIDVAEFSSLFLIRIKFLKEEPVTDSLYLEPCARKFWWMTSSCQSKLAVYEAHDKYC